ncbi:MAG: AAA family ATPase [Clostridia bacterium]
MDLLTTYKTAYGKTQPFEEKKRNAANFFFSCVLMRMQDVINCPENEFGAEDISGIDMLLFFINSMKLKIDDLYTLMKQNSSLNNEDIDSLLYINFSEHKLFSLFNELKKNYPSLIDSSIKLRNEKLTNRNEGNVSYSSFFYVFVTTELLSELAKDKGKVIVNKQVKAFKKFLNEVSALGNIQCDVNIYTSNKFGKIESFKKHSFWKKLYTDMINESTSIFVKSGVQNYNNRVLTKQGSINSNTQHKAIKQNVDFSKLDKLGDFVIGQNEAVEKVKNRLLGSYFGFNDETRPIASFLFTGPTGVGKTETAKAVADICYGGKFLVLDMTTFKTKEDVSRLLGASPNYVGYGDKIEFCDFISNNPVSVVLFEEIDKCHKECLDLLMRMLDEGEFIDAKGKKISLKNTVIFCTTNLSEYVSKNNIEQSVEEKISGNDGLRKEIIGRFDEVIEYKHLSKDNLIKIAKKFVDKKKSNFEINNEEQNLKLNYDNTLLEKIVKEANTDLLGARDLKKSMQKCFVQPVIDILLKNKNLSDSNILVNNTGAEILNPTIKNENNFNKSQTKDTQKSL